MKTLTFQEVKEIIQQRYGLNAAETNQTTKLIIDDTKAFAIHLRQPSDLLEHLEHLESLGISPID